MGIGDEIMAAARAKAAVLALGHGGGGAGPEGQKRAAIIDVRRGHKHRWHPIWTGLPYIAMPGESYDTRVLDAAGDRPYIVQKLETQWLWRACKPPVGEISGLEAFVDYEHAARGYVLICTDLKPSASPNKAWPWDYWLQLVKTYPQVPWAQVGDPAYPRRLPIPYLQTPDFLSAVAAIRGSRGAVLQEGGLHHAAAAVGKPCVVLYGGFISPACTGYDLHTNLFEQTKGYPLGCGMRTPCGHCMAAMRAITPERVHNALQRILQHEQQPA